VSASIDDFHKLRADCHSFHLMVELIVEADMELLFVFPPPPRPPSKCGVFFFLTTPFSERSQGLYQAHRAPEIQSGDAGNDPPGTLGPL
jgi:hypothetical protein